MVLLLIEIREQLQGVQRRLVVQPGNDGVFQGAHLFQPLLQQRVVEQFTQLEADFRVLVGVEGADAGLGGAERLVAQTLLLIGVQQHVIGHQHLTPLGDQQPGGRHARVLHCFQLGDQLTDVQGHAAGDDVGGFGGEDAGREGVQSEAAEIVDDGVARVGPALEADDHVGLLRQQVGDFALALVAPVGAYNCFYHTYKNLRGPGFAAFIGLPYPVRLCRYYTARSSSAQGGKLRKLPVRRVGRDFWGKPKVTFFSQFPKSNFPHRQN